MHDSRVFAAVCLLLPSLLGTRAFNTGADSSACNDLDMKPTGHPEQSIDTNPGKFELEISSTEYDPTDSRATGKCTL